MAALSSGQRPLMWRMTSPFTRSMPQLVMVSAPLTPRRALEELDDLVELGGAAPGALIGDGAGPAVVGGGELGDQRGGDAALGSLPEDEAAPVVGEFQPAVFAARQAGERKL